MASYLWAGRRFTALVGLVVLVGATIGADDNASADRLKKDVTFLASPECEGRGVETKGINKAADYIADEFKKAGLKPAGENGSYFQPFAMTGTSRMDGTNALALEGPQGQKLEFDVHKQFRPLGMSGSGKVAAPIVFAGYGATAKDIGYDDYKDQNVEGKIVLLLRRTPRADSQHAPFDGQRAAQHASLQDKMVNATQHKAAAVLLVNDRGSAKNNDDALIDFNYTAFGARLAGIPVVHIKRSVADALVQSALGTSLSTLEEDIDRDLKPRSAPLTGWTANLETGVKRPKLDVKNVVGVVEGEGPLADETVVIGAHYDHLGYGNHSSLAKGLKEPTIHPGADDNASGTSALLELARRFGKQKDGRRLVFIAFSGEESGLFGSAHYCKNPIFPLKDTAAMVNLDMVGRLRADDKTKKDKLEVHGTGTAKTFNELIDKLNETHKFQLVKQPGGNGPSDHQSFYQQKVPVFFFFTGNHGEYHRPTDTAERINVAGIHKVTNLVDDLVGSLRTVKEKPTYVAVAGGTPTGSFSGPRIGIMPAYNDEGDGVLLEGVSEGGPASKAGLQKGDRIIEVEGKPAKDLTTYMTLMARQKKGEPVNLTVVRDKKQLTIKVQPE